MKRRELKQYVYDCYLEFLKRQQGILLMEDEVKDADMVYGDGATLPSGMDQILAKFPTLRHALIRLHSEDWEQFVQGITWVSPKPTIFRIQLKNGQDYTLKWMGQDFEAEISGKKYYLGQIGDYQQALNKLSILYQEGPMGEEEPEETGGGSEPSDFGGGASGGGDFPGEEESGSEEGGEDEGEDVGGEDIDFETDDSI